MGVFDCFMRKMMQRGDCKIVIRSLRERKDRYSGIFNFWSAGIGTQGMKIFLDFFRKLKFKIGIVNFC